MYFGFEPVALVLPKKQALVPVLEEHKICWFFCLVFFVVVVFFNFGLFFEVPAVSD